VSVDGTQKQAGFLGELKNKDGSIMTELSFSIEIDGQEILMPAVVPTLTPDEVKHLQETQEITPEIEKKAIDHAMKRMDEGKSPFADATETP